MKKRLRGPAEPRRSRSVWQEAEITSVHAQWLAGSSVQEEQVQSHGAGGPCVAREGLHSSGSRIWRVETAIQSSTFTRHARVQRVADFSTPIHGQTLELTSSVKQRRILLAGEV